MINGTGSKPFNMATLPPAEGGSMEMAAHIREISRNKYGKPRAEVEHEINKSSTAAEDATKAALAAAEAARVAAEQAGESSGNLGE